jgi:hypothetical protein
MTWEEWESEFLPVTTRGSYFLDTHGPEWDTVAAANPANVWTVVDGGGIYLDVINGCRFINRLNYVITERPAESGVDYYVTNHP